MYPRSFPAQGSPLAQPRIKASTFQQSHVFLLFKKNLLHFPFFPF